MSVVLRLFSAGACLAVASVALGETAILTPVRDTTLIEDDPTYSNGAGSGLFTGAIASGGNRRALVRFDVSAALPPLATVTGATLRIVINRAGVGSGANDPASLHRLTADWGEGTSATSGGGGTLASPEDATWLYRFYGNPAVGIPRVPWAVAGGDFVATPSVTRTIGGVGAYQFDNTPGMLADVEAWLADPATNFGWVLIGPEDGDQNARRLDSRESGAIGSRPTLTITYTPAPPGEAEVPLPLWSLGLLAAAFGAIGGQRLGRQAAR